MPWNVIKQSKISLSITTERDLHYPEKKSKTVIIFNQHSSLRKLSLVIYHKVTFDDAKLALDTVTTRYPV